MRNKNWLRIVALAGVAACGTVELVAQEWPLDAHSSVKINLPTDSPVTLVSANMGESRATARGSALVLDLHMVLGLRNTGPQALRGVTFRVVAQEVTLGGKASVAVPSLNVAPGAQFPVRIDVQLVRPALNGAGPLVEVDLDGALFQNMAFYGPNRLNSKRSLTAWEMEAERDRRHFKSVLASVGPQGLRASVLDSLSRQQERPRLDVRVLRGGRSVTSAAMAPERTGQFAFLDFPDSPVAPVAGWAWLSDNQARAPQVEVVNRSQKPVRYVELGWLVRDQQGREYMAASLPASDPELYLPAGKTAKLLQETSLKFSRGGQPVAVDSMRGFISQVEFTDGTMWVPNRQNLQNAELQRALAPSAEEQRLTDLYRRKGLDALIEELKKY